MGGGGADPNMLLLDPPRGIYSGDLFVTHIFGKTQVGAWAQAVAGTETRLTYGTGEYVEGGAFVLEGTLQKTQYTPASPAQFIRSMKPQTLFGIVFGIEFDSPCKVDTLRALGGVGLDGPKSALEATNLSAMSDYLVKSNAKLTFDVIGNKPHPAVESLFAGSHCSTADLGECKRVLDALEAEMKTWIAGTSRAPTLDALENVSEHVLERADARRARERVRSPLELARVRNGRREHSLAVGGNEPGSTLCSTALTPHGPRLPQADGRVGLALRALVDPRGEGYFASIVLERTEHAEERLQNESVHVRVGPCHPVEHPVHPKAVRPEELALSRAIAGDAALGEAEVVRFGEGLHAPDEGHQRE
jgi:hypothetical protein